MDAYALTPARRPLLPARLVTGAALALAGGLALAGPAAAHTAADLSLTVGAAPLDRATVAAGAVASLHGPGIARVAWELDGHAAAGTATYAVVLPATAGTHRLRAEVTTTQGVRETVRARFTVSRAAAVPAPAPSAAPTTTPTSGGTSVTAPAATGPTSSGTVSVSTASALRAALASARPGTVIALAPGTYTGTFTAVADGTASAPITLRGGRGAVLTTGSTSKGYALHVTGSHWQVEGLSVRTAAKGIVLDGSVGTVIDGVEVSDIGEEGVHFRAGSSDGMISNSVIHDTGTRKPEYGEGIYVGSAHSNWGTYTGGAPDRSDRVVVANNSIYDTAAEGVDVKEGTTGGTIRGNSFRHAGYSGKNSADSWVDVKGNGWTVTGNTGSTALLDAFQVHVVVAGWGQDNVFSANTASGGVPGYVVAVYPQPGSHGNVIGCDNVMRTGGRGRSNIACSAVPGVD